MAIVHNILVIVFGIASLGILAYSIILIIKMIKNRNLIKTYDEDLNKRSFLPYSAMNFLALLYLGIFSFPTPEGYSGITDFFTEPFHSYPLVIALLMGVLMHWLAYKVMQLIIRQIEKGNVKEGWLIYYMTLVYSISFAIMAVFWYSIFDMLLGFTGDPLNTLEVLLRWLQIAVPASIIMSFALFLDVRLIYNQFQRIRGY